MLLPSSAPTGKFAFVIICPIFFSSESHFVQPNVICPAPAVQAVPTFCRPADSIGYP